ncbi:MAG: hypothetical protein OIF50_12395 [Flavobacteriaceae bacterium]|nr:hypothetical protein [Flavobacteriaceae bacterium]
MKGRHKQKLIVLSLVLLVLLNIPVILMFNSTKAIFGFPLLYFSVFLIWLIAIVMSIRLLWKYYE